MSFKNCCTGLLLGVIATGCAAANRVPLASVERPLLTIDAILSHAHADVSDVSWYDDRSLLATVQLRGEEHSQARLISLDGSLGEPLGRGELAASSPDGRAILQRVDDGWVLTELDSGATTALPRPRDKEGEYRAWLPPRWSQDGRYAVCVEKRRTEVVTASRLEPTLIGGVPVIELDAESAQHRVVVELRYTIIERARPASPRRIVLEGGSINLNWGPGGVLYLSRADRHANRIFTEILVLEPNALEPRVIYRTKGVFESLSPIVSPDGRKLAVVLDADNRTWPDFQSLILLDLRTAQESRITHDLPIASQQAYWSVDGREIYAIVRGGGLTQVWAIPIDGRPRQLTSGLRRHYELDLSPDGRRLSYQTQDGYGRRDIRVFDLRSGRESVVYIADEPAREFVLGEWRHIRWNSTDGVQPYGYVILPPGFASSRRYPMIVDVHGGGPGSSLHLNAPFAYDRGPLEWHAWAALGYVVFVPDYRSTGDYGPEIIAARLKSGEYSPIDDADDAITGVRHMIAQGYIDPGRIAIRGISAGGARAYNALVLHDELFAAGVIFEAIAPDPLSQAIIANSGPSTGGRLWDLSEDPEQHRVNTMFEAIRLRTPTLIIMGDGRRLGGVEHWPYEVIFSILQNEGVPARMLIFPEEGHGFSRPQSSRVAFEDMRLWLETHMPSNQQ